MPAEDRTSDVDPSEQLEVIGAVLASLDEMLQGLERRLQGSLVTGRHLHVVGAEEGRT